MFFTTTNINQEYEILDLVFILSSEVAGGFMGSGGIDIDKAMSTAKTELKKKAEALGADGIIGLVFDQRVAVAGSMVQKQALEIFGFGTAIKLIK